MMTKGNSGKVVLVDEALLESLLDKVERLEARLQSLSGERERRASLISFTSLFNSSTSITYLKD